MPKTSECKEEIYKSIGKKIYNLRLTNNVCVKEFSKTLGVSCHQLYKYEKGINKISLGRLFILAKIFQVELKYFYQDLENSNFINYNPVSNIKFEIADTFTKIPNLERKKESHLLIIKISCRSFKLNRKPYLAICFKKILKKTLFYLKVMF